MRFRFDLSCEPCVIQRSYFFIELHAASRPVIYPFKSPHEIEMPVCSSELSVGDDVIARSFLLCNYVADSIFCHPIELLLIYFSFCKQPPCLLQLLRTQETSYKIITKRCL